ncbi:hypothetical protein DKX38_006702 [Salix brachista]|uniref:TF-B3 domain-containing protein n=1 Tax=Salix brachista TaxID=2182728 RepID=A0A5N5N2H9_9ROSI|nr:hypothetical protein DKX38_006702 [Salix brachista]
MDCLVYNAKPWKQGEKERENLTGRPRIPPKFAKHLVNLPGILRRNAGLLASKGIRTFCILKKFDVTIYGKDGCEKNLVAATEKKTEPPSCVGKQNEVDQPVGKDQKHGTNIETIDIESDSNIEPDISMTKLNDQQQPQCQKNLPKRFLMQHIKVKQQKITLGISKKTWSVKLVTSGYHPRLREGWTAFVKSNSLKIAIFAPFKC